MTRYALGLGSNLGDRLGHLTQAVEALAGTLDLVAVSGLYQTDPIGGPEQDPYLNAVVVVESDLEPEALLAVAQSVEQSAGRVRKERWGPRTLDIDIVASDGPSVDTESLTVPHPRAYLREFVLRPLVDVWPGVEVGEGLSATEALSALEDQGVALVEVDWWKDQSL